MSPVRVGDTIRATVETVDVRPTSKGNRAIVKSAVVVYNQHGETVQTFSPTLLVDRRPA